ncbi:amidohydrolase family protein [soil metagenome]
MARTIDAHQHFWNRSEPFDYAWLDARDKSPIRHNHLPEDLEPHLRENSVDATICVQTQHNLEENRWALHLAEKHAFIAGVVGWVDLADPNCEQQLLELKDHPKFVGIRHITQDEPDDDFIVRPDVMNGLRVLEKHRVPFDLLFYVKHLKHVSTLANELPELPLVIDHLGKPNIRDKQFDEWEKTFREAGRFPNVYCKLSGLITEADWQHWSFMDLVPYVQTALEVFGPERCMFGSDWPVCKLAGSYGQVKDALTLALGPLDPSTAHAIFGGTAEHFYRLK